MTYSLIISKHADDMTFSKKIHCNFRLAEMLIWPTKDTAKLFLSK